MAISFPLNLPTNVSPKRVTIAALNQVGVTSSPFTFQTQVQQHAGQQWVVEVTLPPLTDDQVGQWQAFLLSLNGAFGTFRVGDIIKSSPKGSAPGTPLVNGASQSGSELVTDGWTASQPGILLAGDYINLGNDLHMILKDVNSDSGGNATLDIWPSLRSSPADDLAITTVNTKGTFRLTEARQDISVADERRVFLISFAGIEAIN